VVMARTDQATSIVFAREGGFAGENERPAPSLGGGVAVTVRFGLARPGGPCGNHVVEHGDRECRLAQRFSPDECL
jgi:hypothetical protein